MSEHGQQLWCAAIQQALDDATNLTCTTLTRLEQDRARAWLTVPNLDFEEICALAGLEASAVRSAAIRLIDAAKQQPLAQRRQSKRAKLYEFQGRSLTIPQWAAETGMNSDTLYYRVMKQGWTIEAALTTKPYQRSRNSTPGVVDNFSKSVPDRSLPSTQETTELEFFE